MRGLDSNQRVIFLLTYVCMLCKRSCLESWSLLKGSYEVDIGMPVSWLGSFDSFFLVTYATGDIINGRLCDKYPAKTIVGMGLMGSSVALLGVCILGYFQVASPYAYIFPWMLEGWSQSAIYPGCTKIMGKHIPQEKRGRLMGLWTSNLNVGNVFGALLTTSLTSFASFSWELVLVVLCSIIVLPSILSFVRPDDYVELNDGPKHALSFADTLRIRGLVSYASGYACIKFMNYTFLMWLPLYMTHSGLSTVAVGGVMICYEISGALGSYLIGWTSDKLKSRIIPILGLLALSLPNAALFLLISNPHAIAVCGVLAGFCNISISSIVLGTVTIDLSKDNVGAVCGVLDGFASLATGIGMLCIGMLQTYGWWYSWGLLVIINTLAFVPFVRIKINQK